MEINAASQLRLVLRALSKETESSGPDPTASIVSQIVSGNWSGVTQSDISMISGYKLSSFTFEDPGAFAAVQSQVWTDIMNYAEQLWKMANLGEFPVDRFVKPTDYGPDNRISHLMTQISIAWGR